MIIDIIKLRKQFLKEFDGYVRDVIGDDEITYDIWCTRGLPDGYDENDLEEIARDDDLWLDCVECFADCVRVSES